MITLEKKKKLGLISGIVLLLLVAFGAGFISAGGQISVKDFKINFTKAPVSIINKELGKPKEVDFALFWDAWNTVLEKYVGTADPQKMLEGAIRGMLASLGDPYTVFLTKDEAEQFQKELQGEFEGIGAEIGIKNEKIVIISPLDDSPAKKAGLKSGDIVLKIDDADTKGMSLDDAVTKIRGQKDTKLKLQIQRGEKKIDVEITRALIKIKTVKWENKNGYAYIKISHFDEQTAEEFVKIKKEVLAANPKGIVVDLRGNPGGFLDVSLDIISEFLPTGKVILKEEFKGGKTDEHKSQGGDFTSTPLVVLVDEGSASASEIFAGAVQDNNRAKIIGKTTFGKGTVQDLEELAGGNIIKITIARWLTPLSKSITDQGVKPDIEVNLTDDDFNNNRDPQLDRALEYLKKGK